MFQLKEIFTPEFIQKLVITLIVVISGMISTIYFTNSYKFKIETENNHKITIVHENNLNTGKESKILIKNFEDILKELNITIKSENNKTRVLQLSKKVLEELMFLSKVEKKVEIFIKKEISKGELDLNNILQNINTLINKEYNQTQSISQYR